VAQILTFIYARPETIRNPLGAAEVDEALGRLAAELDFDPELRLRPADGNSIVIPDVAPEETWAAIVVAGAVDALGQGRHEAGPGRGAGDNTQEFGAHREPLPNNSTTTRTYVRIGLSHRTHRAFGFGFGVGVVATDPAASGPSARLGRRSAEQARRLT
jgi:hypothetical protein